MPDAEAFLRTIIAHPFDDGPRLVYADWLEEHGDCDRAEFIRTQIEADRLDEDDPRREGLEQREGELFDQHWATWLGPVFAALGEDVNESTTEPLLRLIRRRLGLQSRLAPPRRTVTGGVIIRRPAPGYVGRGRVIREVICTRGWPDHVALQAGSGLSAEALGRLLTTCPVHLLILLWGAADDVTRLLGPHTGGLQALELSSGESTTALVRLVHVASRSPHLGGLRELRLAARPVDALTVNSLANSPLLPRLERLHLAVDSPGIPLIVERTAFACLKYLDVELDGSWPVAFHRLTQSSHLAGLTGLTIRPGPRVLEDIPAMLAASPFLTGLTQLRLNSVPLTAHVLTNLAAVATLGRLRSLRLDGGNPAPRLDLPQISAGLRTLAASPHLAELRELALPYQRLHAGAAAALVAGIGLPRLTALSLSGNEIGDDGAIALASGPAATRLRRLDVSHNQIGDAGALALAESSALAGLTALDVRGNEFSRAGRAALRERFGPRVRIEPGE